MARGINKVILLGHLGRDPEVKYMPNGNAVANIAIATSEGWKDKQTGQQHEKTEWHRVVIFGKLAEIAGQYLKKGSLVYIEGKNQTRKYQDKSGRDCYITEVVVDFNGSMQMLDRKDDQNTQGDYQQDQSRTQKPTSSNNAYMAAKNGDPMPDFDSGYDDLPF